MDLETNLKDVEANLQNHHQRLLALFTKAKELDALLKAHPIAAKTSFDEILAVKLCPQDSWLKKS